jgi:5-(carboxyamino)imidazole ribonucleotide synthase
MKIGVIGAGQLGQMLALAGYPLGIRFLFVDQSADAPGAQVGPIILGAFDDATQLHALADQVDVVTFEFENVPADAITSTAARKTFLPPPAALAASQDRLTEKALFRELGIPTAPHRAVDNLADLSQAVEQIGLPGILKTRRLGYDGKGQFVIKTRADIERAWEELGTAALIYEGFVKFTREVSLIGARSTTGETRFYPLTANVHSEAILRHSIAPWSNARLQRIAETYLKRLLRHFDYAGVLTVEFFVAKGVLVANEMAPRVHNSGHWTIEGAATSQFENHVRAVCGLPLGDTRAIGHSGMVNFIGQMPAAADVLHVQGAHLHDYGKAARANRKLGHATVVATSAATRDRQLKRLVRLSTGAVAP